MVLFSTSLLMLGLAAAFAPGSSRAATATRPRIVVLGDSLTSGHGIGPARAFPATLQQKLDQRGYEFVVVNAGVSGDTSARAVARLEDALRGDVRVLIVALGANDGLRGVPVAELRANLTRIIQAARARGIHVLLCGMEALPMYGWNYAVAFHQLYADLARSYDLPLVPFIMMNVLGNPALMQPDRVHPNADGARAIGEQIWPYLDRLLERTGYSRSVAT
jgi:acyl-CoA thioesterase-1